MIYNCSVLNLLPRVFVEASILMGQMSLEIEMRRKKRPCPPSAANIGLNLFFPLYFINNASFLSL
jgi:hypothetical protein